jgi:acyl-CoA dehydrogenase
MTAFELEPQYEAVREEALAVAAMVEPFAAEADESSTLDARVYDTLRASGLCALVVPATHGGREPEVDPVAVAVVREAFMATSSHLDSIFALQGIGSFGLSRAGHPSQQDFWLPRVASCDVLAALALTEPEAGSDLKSVTTTMTETEGGELEISGTKSYISNAGVAGFYSVFAREHEMFSLVIVPSDADGLTTTAGDELIAPHVIGDLHLTDVRVDARARIGARGDGLEHVLATLAVFRVSVAAAAVGLARAALEEAVRHASTRRQFGQPLARHGAVAGMLADSWAEIEAARVLTYRAASRARLDPGASLAHSSMAKLIATETAGRVVDRCVQVMGRWGLVRGSKVERCYRQARPMRIYEGSSEILRLGIARDLVEEITA